MRNKKHPYDARRASACLESRGGGLPSASSTFDITCLAASVRGPEIAYAKVVSCMLPCVQHFLAAWGERNMQGDNLWSRPIAADFSKRHGPTHPLLLSFHNELTLSWAGNVYTKGRYGVHYAKGRNVTASKWVALEYSMPYLKADRDAVRALGHAAEQRTRVSVLTIADYYLPASRSILDHEGLACYFTTNPTPEPHPRLSPYPRAVFRADVWEQALSAAPRAGWQPWGWQRATRPRPRQLMCHEGPNDARLGNPPRTVRLRSLTRNGFRCTAGRLSAEAYATALRSSRAVFAPRGSGEAEHKFWEAALANAVILTDIAPSQVLLLTGLRVVMLGHGAWEGLTPATLDALLAVVEARHRQYDAMRAFFPQWMYRLHTGTAASDRDHSGRQLAPPLIVNGSADLALLTARRPGGALGARRPPGGDGGALGGDPPSQGGPV